MTALPPERPDSSAPLRSVARVLDAGEFAALRSLAFAGGVVVERDGLSVLGFGEARAFALPNGLTDPLALRQLQGSLAAIGHGALAIGAFHFLPDAGVSLSVPEVCVRATDGSAAARAGDLQGSEAPPDSFRLESRRPHEDFLQRLGAAIGEVRSGRLDKVVMAREVLIEANRPFRQGDLLERLRTLHPSCATFAVDGFLGATPELLIRRFGGDLESHPLAGTAARSGDPEVDRRVEAAMLASDKERSEHRAVVDAITDGLAPAMVDLSVPDEPGIVELRNVSHLGTRITGRIAAGPDGETRNALELLALIHPTPAVSGTPLDLALDYLAKAEELDRDRYAGAVGWMNGDGDGEWYLGIRCAIVADRSARLFAGVGIVADSDPAAELAETQLKLQAFLAAAVRP